MADSASAGDRIFVHEHYTLHYRSAPPRVQWASAARLSYTALLLLEGALFWWSEGGEPERELKAPGAILAAPGQTLKVSGQQAHFILASLAPGFILDCAVRARLTRADAEITFPTQSIAGDERLARIARDLADELRAAEAGREIVIAALMEQGTVYLLRRYANIRRSDELELSRAGLVDRRLRRAVELMHAKLDRELPLEELAAAAYLSPFHFSRLFKKVTGASPHAYLATLRIERAQQLLATTDLSITEISTRVGYASSSHFGKAFRQANGLTPRAFREALYTPQEK